MAASNLHTLELYLETSWQDPLFPYNVPLGLRSHSDTAPPLTLYVSLAARGL